MTEITLPRRIYTVSELNQRIKFLLEQNFADVWLKGEVSNVRRPASGHTYFTLKDNESQLRAVLFQQHQRFLKFQVEDGIEVLCWGHISTFLPRGEYQIIVDHIEPYGIGSLHLAFEQLKEKLSREGLFDESRKRRLPFLPRRVGLVTSASGAAVHDMITILTRRYPNIEIILSPAQVQGEGAAQSIVQAIEALNEWEEGVDVIIAGRGGGSLEDLWPFNEEAVARAIAASRAPVVSAVGHETDYTIADFVADVRAPTPSAAAEMVVPEKERLAEAIDAPATRMYQTFSRRLRDHENQVLQISRRLPNLQSRIEQNRLRLDELLFRMERNQKTTIIAARRHLDHSARLMLSIGPHRVLPGHISSLQHLSGRLATAMSLVTSRKKQELSIFSARLETMDTGAVLRRGFAIVRRYPELKAVKSARQLKSDDRISIEFHKGKVDAKVE